MRDSERRRQEQREAREVREAMGDSIAITASGGGSSGSGVSGSSGALARIHKDEGGGEEAEQGRQEEDEEGGGEGGSRSMVVSEPSSSREEEDSSAIPSSIDSSSNSSSSTSSSGGGGGSGDGTFNPIDNVIGGRALEAMKKQNRKRRREDKESELKDTGSKNILRITGAAGTTHDGSSVAAAVADTRVRDEGGFRSRPKQAKVKDGFASKYPEVEPMPAPRPRPLPHGWERVESRSKKGTFYFRNKALQKTQWEPPNQ